MDGNFDATAGLVASKDSRRGGRRIAVLRPVPAIGSNGADGAVIETSQHC